MKNTVDDLISKIKEFAYEGKFCENGLKVFSNKYLGAVLFNKYKSNKDLYSFIYGDFDKVGELNLKFGKPAVDVYIKKSLQIITSCLPENSYICRISGDEFAIIIENADKKLGNLYIKEINEKLQIHSNETKELTITLACTDSSELATIGDVYFTCESKVQNIKKQRHKSNNSSVEDTLNSKIRASFNNFFNFYRLPENFCITASKVRELRSAVIEILAKNLEDNTDDSKFSRNSKLNILNGIPQNFANEINDIVCYNKEPSKALDISTLEAILNYLIHEPLSDQFSKDYFNKFLLPEFNKNPNQSLNAYLFNLTHMKLSNEIIGHPETDIKMSELLTTVTKELTARKLGVNEEQIHFNFKSFDIAADSNFIVQYGPNLMVFLRDGSSLTDKDLSAILSKTRKSQNILNLVTSSVASKSSFTDIDIALSDLKLEANKKKELLKINKFNSPKSIIALEAALYDCIDFYSNNVPNSNSITQKAKFLNELVIGAIDVVGSNYNNLELKELCDRNQERE